MIAMTRFGLTVAALSLMLAIATVAIFLRGDQSDLTPLAVSPNPGAEGVSAGATVRIQFARAMRPGSVEERLRLDPPAEGVIEWVGSSLSFTPRRPLRPDTDYTVTLAAGLEEMRGRVSRQPYRWHFRTRSPQVVMLSRQGGAANLWQHDPASGATRALTSETVDIVDFSLAPDGSRAVYTRQDSPSRTSLRLVDLQSGAVTPFAPDEAGALSTPAWGPDGVLIVFERRQLVTNGIANPKLFAARADGGGSNLVYGRGDEVGFGARWSPDGRRLAFFDPVRTAVIVFSFSRDLIVVPIQTTVAFVWSPDGRSLLIEDIVIDGSSFRHVLLVADVAGGSVRRLSADTTIDEATPTWSPDGAWLAFTRKSNTAALSPAQPWISRPDGSEARPVLPPMANLETIQLAWSSDGQRLLVGRLDLTDGRGEPQVWLADPSGATPPRRLGRALQAAWLP